MEKKKVVKLLMLAALGAVVASGCGKEDKIESKIISGDGSVIVSDNAIETETGSGKEAEKELEIPEGTYKFSVENFTVMNSSFQINLVPGESSSIKVDDNVLDDFGLEVDEEKKELTFKTSSEGAYTGIHCTVTIGVDVDSVQVGGVANVAYTVPESVGTVSIHAEGSSNVTAKGECQSVSYDVLGAANVDGTELKCTDGEIKAEGSAMLKVNCSGSLKISASGASQVTYSGNPAQVEKEISGSASVVTTDEV